MLYEALKLVPPSSSCLIVECMLLGVTRPIVSDPQRLRPTEP